MSSRFSRKPNNLKPRKVIRIFTEGTKTEPNYFNSIRTELRLVGVEIKVDGLKRSTTSLVDWVIERKSELSRTDEENTEWWVVFDRDDHSGFNQSIQRAEAEGINVAYSNECFELWFILHFELLSTAIGREKYYEKLTKILGYKYEKNTDIYNLIKDKESTAIKNAKALEKEYSDAGITSYEKMDPSTSVYKLVERMRSFKVSP